jgi:hypothetical protein
METNNNNTERYLENYNTKELVVLLCMLMSEKPKSFIEHSHNLCYIVDIQREFHEFRKLSEATVSDWVSRYVNGDLN